MYLSMNVWRAFWLRASLLGNSCVWTVGNVGNGSNPQLYQTTHLLPAPPSRRLLRNKKIKQKFNLKNLI